jgi:hypothetical protein
MLQILKISLGQESLSLYSELILKFIAGKLANKPAMLGTLIKILLPVINGPNPRPCPFNTPPHFLILNPNQSMFLISKWVPMSEGPFETVVSGVYVMFV